MGLLDGVKKFLFGGGDPALSERNAAGSVAHQNYLQTLGALQPAQQYGNSLGQRFGGQSQDDLQAYLDYLGHSVTDQQRSAYSNQLLGNTDNSFAQGQSQLAAQMAQQGQTSPLDSSVSAGQLASLYAQRAGAIGQAGAGADQFARNLQSQNLQNRFGAASGAAGQGANLQMQGAELMNSAGNDYTGQLTQLAQMAAQAKAAGNIGALQAISQIGQTYGAFKGGQGVQQPTAYGGPLPGRATEPNTTPTPIDASTTAYGTTPAYLQAFGQYNQAPGTVDDPELTPNRSLSPMGAGRGVYGPVSSYPSPYLAPQANSYNRTNRSGYNLTSR